MAMQNIADLNVLEEISEEAHLYAESQSGIPSKILLADFLGLITDDLDSKYNRYTIWSYTQSQENNFVVPSTYPGRPGDVVVVTTGTGSGGALWELKRVISNYGTTQYIWESTDFSGKMEKIYAVNDPEGIPSVPVGQLFTCQGSLLQKLDNGQTREIVYREQIPNISGKENISNKATIIDSEADDTHYPSALAVKSYVDAMATSEGCVFVDEIPADADHAKKIVLPDGYIYTWQDGSPSVPHNANTHLVNQCPKLNTNKDTLETCSGVLVSDLIPYGRDWKYSEDGRVYISGISEIVPAYSSSLIIYYYRRDTGAYIGTLQSAQISSMNYPASNSAIALPVSLKISDPAIAFSGVDVSDPGKDIGYVRILLGISTQGDITENDVKDLVINVPYYDTPATPAGWKSTGVKHPYYSERLPEGGTAGQLLFKTADGAAWHDKADVFDVQTGQKLYAVGDSITYGYGPNSTHIDSWFKYVVERNGYDAANSLNLAENSLGFCTTSTKGHTIADIVGGTNFASADIVTVALGINDWKNSTATLAALWSGMEYCFNKIRTDNLFCKIYFILPFNVSFSGSYANFYGLGFKGDSDASKCYGNTLQTFINLIKAKFSEPTFKAYRVELIDMTECPALNRNNITTALFDNFHPSAETHAELGKEIARLLSVSRPKEQVPSKTSDLINDSGFLTQHQDISGKMDLASLHSGGSTEDIELGQLFLTRRGLSDYNLNIQLSQSGESGRQIAWAGDIPDVSGKQDKQTNLPEVATVEYHGEWIPDTSDIVFQNLSIGQLFQCDILETVHTYQKTSASTYFDLHGVLHREDLPANVSAFANDAGYLTAQGITGKMDLAQIRATIDDDTQIKQGQFLVVGGDVWLKTGAQGTAGHLVLEDKANKVNSISSSSTTDQYPSALAVKNYVDTVIGGIENGSY